MLQNFTRSLKPSHAESDAKDIGVWILVESTVSGWISGGDTGASFNHDDVIKWKHFPHYWPFVRGIHRSPVNSPHKGQWRGDLMFSLVYAWTDSWTNNGDAGDLRRYRARYDAIVMRRSKMTLEYVSIS